MEALAGGQGEGGEALSDRVEVYNTLDWPRTDLIVLAPDVSRIGDRVVEVGGAEVPSQRLTTGELAFLAEEVPARGTKSFQVVGGGAVEAGDAPSAGASRAKDE